MNHAFQIPIFYLDFYSVKKLLNSLLKVILKQVVLKVQTIYLKKAIIYYFSNMEAFQLSFNKIILLVNTNLRIYHVLIV